MLKAKGNNAINSSLNDSIENYQGTEASNIRASRELKSLIKKQRSMSAVSEKMSQQS